MEYLIPQKTEITYVTATLLKKQKQKQKQKQKNYIP